MLILALETTGEIASVALWDSEPQQLRCEVQVHAYQTLTQYLPAFVQSALTHAKVDFKAIDLIAVSLGPGSFTSVRVGLAFAKGLAMALDKPLLGVRTTEALALAATTCEGDLLATLYPSRPSRPTEVYSALFRVCGGTLRQEREERAEEFAELMASLKERPEERFTLVGVLPPGASLLLAKLRREKRIALSLTPVHPSARFVAQRAWQRWQQNPSPDDPIRLVPHYVLPSSAESREGKSLR